ncbi:MAG: hypothetical protein R2712_13645 [Vicinamibacterales bacterium]
MALQDGPHVVSSAKRYDWPAASTAAIDACWGLARCSWRPPTAALRSRARTAGADHGDRRGRRVRVRGPVLGDRPRLLRAAGLRARAAHRRAPGGGARQRRAAAILVRAGEDRDIPGITEISAACAGGARLAIERSEDFIRFGIARRRLLAGLGPIGVREVEFLVSEEGHQPVAYLVCVAYRGGWTLVDAGDRDPAGARLGAMLQVMLARHPGEAVPGSGPGCLHACARRRCGSWWPRPRRTC